MFHRIQIMKPKASSDEDRSKGRKKGLFQEGTTKRPRRRTTGAKPPKRAEAAPDGSGSNPPIRRKAPVPVGAVWWSRAEGHPCLRFFGTELRAQRWEERGWSLEDLHAASGLAKSFLSELESGKKMPSEEVILELEAALEMPHGGLMRLVQRRWMKAVARKVAEQTLAEPLKRQMRAIRRALERQALALWLPGCGTGMHGDIAA